MGQCWETPYSFLPQPMQNATKYGNMTQDHVMRLLLVSGTWPGIPELLPHPHKPPVRLCFKTCAMPGSQQTSNMGSPD